MQIPPQITIRDHAEDVHIALRDAFDAAKRQLEDYARKMRGDVKTHQPKRRPEKSDDDQQIEVSDDQ